MPLAERFSRRGFLRHSAQVAGGAMLLPELIPSGVLAREGRPGANDHVNLGYIGVGHRGPQLMTLPKDARIAAVCDVDQRHCDAVAKSQRCRTTRRYRELLEAKDIDAVVIATPEHWHALPMIEACQAGKDIYCEKPLGLTVREGRAMVTAAKKYRRVVQVGTHQRSMVANRLGCEAVRNGLIGNVREVISSEYASPWDAELPERPVPAKLDWDTWCGQTELRPYHPAIYPPYGSPGWTSLRRHSGGRMTGWGVHGLDQLQRALGMEQTGPVEIWVEGKPFNPPTYRTPEKPHRGIEICKQPRIRMRYANGVVVKLDGGTTWGGIFLGERGKITIDRGIFRTQPRELAEIPPKDNHYEAGNEHLKNWIDCIKSRQSPRSEIEAAHRSTTVCHLGNIARWLGRRLHWDPEREIFPGDHEANALLERRQRAPYCLPDTV